MSHETALTSAQQAGRDELTEHEGKRRGSAPWILVGALIFLLGAGWAAAVPLMASPDEPSHVVRAAAVARGQLSGELGPAPTDASRPGAGTIVQLPSDYAQIIAQPNCLAFQADVPADCQPPVAPPDDGGPVPVETFAGQYPPLYYALVGWPSLFLAAESATYAMRLVSAAISAVLLTWGVVGLARTLGRGFGVWAAVVALTPMCLFFMGTVNPQGLEISAGLAFWAGCLALLLGRGQPPRSVLAQVAVCGAILVNVRTSSPFWAVAILVVSLILASPGRWREVLSDRGTRVALAVGALASVTAVGWVATHRDVVTDAGLFPEFGNPIRTVLVLSGRTYEFLLNMVGNFGWLDAPAPPLTYVSWFVVVGSMLLIAVAVRTSRRRTASLVVLLAIVVGAPFVFQIPTAPDTGIIWQGRYVLPLAVGVPLVAAALIGATEGPVRDLLRRVSRFSVPVLGIAHVAAFWWGSRRYSEGLSGEVITTAPSWSSPIGYLTGVVAYAVVIAVLGTLAWRSLQPEPAMTPVAAV